MITPPKRVYDRTCEILDANSRLDDAVRYVYNAGAERVAKSVLAAYDRFIESDDIDAFARSMGRLRAQTGERDERNT